MSEVPITLREALADRYALERELGSGGMARVYLATDVRHERRVAVKVLRPELAATLGVDRFLREIRIAAQLNHPHIVPLLDSGDADRQLFYVMPHIDGISLRDLLNSESRIEQSSAVAIITEVADAVAYAHRQGVLHRDLKPENILLAEGHAVVTDFGIAKAIDDAGGDNLTRTGFPLGTPGYMSPEQAAGSSNLDGRTDVYSLACVCYELLVGDTPGLWPTEKALDAGRFLEAPPAHRMVLDLVSSAVERTMVKAMAMRPEDRFTTPTEFVDGVSAQPG